MSRRTRSFWWYLLPLIIFGALVYRWRNWSMPFNGLFSRVLYPLVVKQHDVVTGLNDENFRKEDPAVLSARVRELERECNELRAQLTQALASQAYYANIKELLEFKQRYCTNKATVCRVLLKHFGCDEHYFLINCGQSSGVKPGMIAIAHGQLVGRILEVLPQYSKLLLVTDRRCKIAAYCAKTRTAGIYSGINENTRAALNFVNHLNPLTVGDLVISSGQGLVWPEGFGLGTITDFRQHGVSYEVTVRPLVQQENIEYCLVADPHALTAPPVGGVPVDVQAQPVPVVAQPAGVVLPAKAVVQTSVPAPAAPVHVPVSKPAVAKDTHVVAAPVQVPVQHAVRNVHENNDVADTEGSDDESDVDDDTQDSGAVAAD